MEISQAIKIRFTKVVFQVIARIFLTSIENHFQFLDEDNLKKGGGGEKNGIVTFSFIPGKKKKKGFIYS